MNGKGHIYLSLLCCIAKDLILVGNTVVSLLYRVKVRRNRPLFSQKLQNRRRLCKELTACVHNTIYICVYKILYNTRDGRSEEVFVFSSLSVQMTKVHTHTHSRNKHLESSERCAPRNVDK